MQGFRINNSLIKLSYFPKIAQLLVKYPMVKYLFWNKPFCYIYCNCKLEINVE